MLIEMVYANDNFITIFAAPYPIFIKKHTLPAIEMAKLCVCTNRLGKCNKSRTYFSDKTFKRFLDKFIL